MIGARELALGVLVRHEARPDWGLGRVLHLDDGHVHVYFKDVPGDPKAAIRVLARAASHLSLADVQTDAMLDHLPPLIAGRFPSRHNTRVTESQAVEYFAAEFGGFEGASYTREYREYPWRAHELVAEWFTGDDGRGRLASEAPDAMAHRLRELLRLTNLLTKSEFSAVDRAFADPAAAARYGAAVLAFVASPGGPTFGRLSDAAAALSLGAARGAALLWPTATVLPYLACPRDCVFVRPDIARRIADAFCFDVLYDATPGWATYQRFVRLFASLLARLRSLGARDFMDVHAFMEIIAASPLVKAGAAKKA